MGKLERVISLAYFASSLSISSRGIIIRLLGIYQEELTNCTQINNSYVKVQNG